MRGQVAKRRNRWMTALKVALALALAGVMGAIGLLWYYGRDLPSVDAMRHYRPPETTRVLDRNGKTIGEIFTERRTVVPMEQIPRVLVLSVLAAEDADFYQHEGLDYAGIFRAVIRDVLAGRPAQGASTITQQVVKLLLLSPERTIQRKVRELILSRRLEQELTKDEILGLYLNNINFGHGRYGVEEASRYYFGKDVQDLTLAEASLIAGVPQAPARLNPRSHPEAARRRQRYVLDQLEEKRADYWPDLSLETIEQARNAVVHLAPDDETTNEAPGIVALVRKELVDRVGQQALRQGGYVVHTTIDLDLQKKAQQALQKGLREIDARHGYRVPLEAPKRRHRKVRSLAKVRNLETGKSYVAQVTGVDGKEGHLLLDVGGHPAFVRLADLARYNPDHLPPERIAEPGARVRVSILQPGGDDQEGGGQAPAEAQLELGPQGAVVVIDTRTRDVLALVGGYEASAGFNRATQAVRQPGSTFKSIVYAYGIKQRELTPATVVIDAPAVYDKWQPQNYETWSNEGPVRLRVALAKSINLVAVRVIDRLGPQPVADFAKQLGITTPLDPTLGLALGASDVRPIELVNAYATFAAGGRWAPYRIVDRIDGPGVKEIPLPPREEPRQVLSPAEAFVMTSMLQSVVKDGTAQEAQKLGRPVAGKTGTSNEARDAWFVGYTPNVIAGVWVGFDDRRPLGRHESGGHAALPVWIDVLGAAEAGHPPLDFPMPNGVTTARIDPATGLLAYEGEPNAIDEVFLEGTVPTQTARPPEVADPQTYLMEQIGSGAP